ncbi:uncharacterized protein LOC143035212 [Oratosquilla oratoria]|uniref:uncharacterized protein LOC143035212 n=1 Tax=Oratosquilla oratoria TaxID=337810 RepID=UPI003F760A88
MRGQAALLEVRETLDSLGYRESLPPEALPLVQRLLTDLVQACKRAEEFADKKNELEKRCDDLAASVAPYQEDNGRVLTENNALRLQILKAKEEAHHHSSKLEEQVKKLDAENQDLRFLVGEFKNQIKGLEVESRKKSDKILQLQEKNLKAVITTPGGRKNSVAFQRQRLELSSALPRPSMSSTCANCGCEGRAQATANVQAIDLLQMAERKLTEVQSDVARHQQSAEDSRQECTRLRQQIEAREEEIKRLQGLLEGGRTVSSILQDNRLQAAHSRLHQLQMRVDTLTAANTSLEKKLKDVLGNTHDAMHRAIELENENSELAVDLDKVSKTNRKLQEEHYNTTESLADKLSITRKKLAQCEGDLSEQHRLYHLMRDERDRLQGDIVRLRHELSRLTYDHAQVSSERGKLLDRTQHMEGLVEKHQEDKKDMNDKINHLTVKIESLQTENEHLQEQNSKLKTFKDEAERLGDHYRGESTRLANLLEESQKDLELLRLEKGKVDDANKDLEDAKNFYSGDVEKLRLNIEKLQQERERLQIQMNGLEDQREAMEREKDYYSGQVIHLLDILKKKPSSSQSTPTHAASLPQSPDALRADLIRVRHDRDVLQEELKFYKMQYQASRNLQQAKQQQAAAMAATEGVGVAGVAGRGSPGLQIPSRAPSMPAAGESPQLLSTSDSTLEAVKKERDFFKQQMERFLAQYNALKSQGDMRDTEGYPPLQVPEQSQHLEREMGALRQELSVAQKERDFFKKQTELYRSGSPLPQPPFREGVSDDTLDTSTSERIRERNILIQERDFYRSQYNDMSKKLASSLTAPSSPPTYSKAKIESILKEKRDAVVANAELEAQVRSQRERLSEMEEEKNEVEQHSRELHKALDKLQDAAAKNYPPATQAFIADIKKARDSAYTDVNKLKKERDLLRGKLKVSTAQQVRDRATYEEDNKNLRHKNLGGERKAADLQSRLQVQGSLVTSLQDQVQALQDALQKANVDYNEQGKQADKFKKMLYEKSGELGTRVNELQVRGSQIVEAEDRIKELEAEVLVLKQRISDLQADASGLKTNVTRLDRDKDILHAELDAKTEKIANLREELRQRDSLIAQLQSNISSLQTQLESTQANLQATEERLAAARKQINKLEGDLSSVTVARNSALLEIKKLQEDLGKLRAQYKILQQDHERVKASRDEFKLKVQEYCRTLEKLTHVMATKEDEQVTLKDQYLTLSEALVSLKSLNASLEEGLEVRVKEQDKMEALVANFKQEREQLLAQVMEAGEKCDRLEEMCNKLEQEKYNIEKDLVATRDIAVQLDTKKGELEATVRGLEGELQRVLDQRKSLHHKVEGLATQLTKEKSSIRAMEEVVNEKRRAEWTSQAANKTLEVERTMLQRQVSELKQQLEDEVNEVKRLRSRLSQTEAEVERMRRSLTDEKYERERLSQELRRVQRLQRMNEALGDVGSEAPEGGGTTTCATPLTQYVGSRRPSTSSQPPHPHQHLQTQGSFDEGVEVTTRTHSISSAPIRRPPLSRMNTTSTDTGLERSGMDSLDSQKDPWKLAFAPSYRGQRELNRSSSLPQRDSKGVSSIPECDVSHLSSITSKEFVRSSSLPHRHSGGSSSSQEQKEPLLPRDLTRAPLLPPNQGSSHRSLKSYSRSSSQGSSRLDPQIQGAKPKDPSTFHRSSSIQDSDS